MDINTSCYSRIDFARILVRTQMQEPIAVIKRVKINDLALTVRLIEELGGEVLKRCNCVQRENDGGMNSTSSESESSFGGLEGEDDWECNSMVPGSVGFESVWEKENYGVVSGEVSLDGEFQEVDGKEGEPAVPGFQSVRIDADLNTKGNSINAIEGLDKVIMEIDGKEDSEYTTAHNRESGKMGKSLTNEGSREMLPLGWCDNGLGDGAKRLSTEPERVDLSWEGIEQLGNGLSAESPLREDVGVRIAQEGNYEGQVKEVNLSHQYEPRMAETENHERPKQTKEMLSKEIEDDDRMGGDQVVNGGDMAVAVESGPVNPSEGCDGPNSKDGTVMNDMGREQGVEGGGMKKDKAIQERTLQEEGSTSGSEGEQSGKQVKKKSKTRKMRENIKKKVRSNQRKVSNNVHSLSNSI
ncbi:uncharacterized protein LOC130719139 [Lotus japonicus]|uniref:uncharacterized protein LOC130719139 n=1 Tax=Lotus japonicus TaxID=34305 RepID=UPI002587D6BF|nr:uncharacterized protein LOC130719139 [Lotus japonicus]